MKKIDRYLPAAILLAVVAFFVGCFYVGRASADTGVDAGVYAGSSAPAIAPTAPTVALPDPFSAPGESLGMVEKLYKSGAFFCLGIVVVFFLFYAAESKIAWFSANPKRKAYTAAILGALTLIATAAANGTTPSLSTFVAALSTGVALIINPKASSSPS